MNIDEKFESGPGRFGSIESTDSLQYPQKVVANSDLAARLDQLQTLVIAGIVLGGLALLASAAGLVVRRR
jgi:hydroxymethylglutaryl-CoA reductase